MEIDSNYLKDVRLQYEEYPYPERDPNNEKNYLISYENQTPELINHFCFNGLMPLSLKGQGDIFRILIAGGGTGDAAIYYAEILSNMNVEVTYLDMSKSSTKIAKQRAKIRQLKNLKWIHDSILELPTMNLEKFNYIDCSGVLHHLVSPKDGLNALKSVLHDDGALNIMVYAQYGRTSIYQMQNLMRMINSTENNLQIEVDNTKSIISSLPNTNLFYKDKELFTNDINNDIGIYDLLLHTQDRAYTIPQLYNWVEEECNLNIIEFGGTGIESKMGYNPKIYIKDTNLLEKIMQKPLIEQKAIAELLSSTIKKHTFFVTKHKEDTIASYKNEDLVPYLHGINTTGKEVADVIKSQPGMTITFTIDIQGSVGFIPMKSTENIFRLMDGKRSIKEIFEKIDIPNEELSLEFESLYLTLFDLNIILLKSKKFPIIKTVKDAQERINKIYNQ